MDASIAHLQTDGGRKLVETLDRVINGIRDPAASRKALDRLARGREEMRNRLGVVEVAVDLIREARDQ